MTDTLEASGLKLTAIRDLLASMPRPYVDHHRYQEANRAVARYRLEVASFVGTTYLEGAILDKKPVHHDGTSVLDDSRVPRALRTAVAAVPGLTLDHVFLFKRAGKPVALASMPYNHYAEFVSEGANDLAVWKSLDALSWWFPGATKLTIVTPP